jgi:hypothetical protein
MKFNPKSLKQLFSAIRKSPIDDMAVSALKNNADDIAVGALNAVDNMPSTGSTLQKVLNNPDEVGKLYGESLMTPQAEAFMDAIGGKLFSTNEIPWDTSLDADMPTSISFDDIADSYKNRIPVNKPPITSSEFVQNYKANRDNRRYGEIMDELFPNYSQIGDPADIPLPTSPPKTNEWIKNYVDMRDNYIEHLAYMGYPSNFDYDMELYDAGYKFDSTPDYDAMDIRPERFGQSPYPIDHILYPDGFEDPEDFARYYTALEQGYISKEIAPYIYPTHSRVPWRSPMRTKRELGAVQQALDPYTVSGDIPANSPELARLYRTITGRY